METGAAGGSGPGAAFSRGAAAIMASHSLRVILLLQLDGGADQDFVDVHAPAFFGWVYFQGFYDAFRRGERRALVLGRKMHRDVLHRVIRVVHQVDQYNGWKAQRNPKRAELEAKFGYDTKHAMHLVRLM